MTHFRRSRSHGHDSTSRAGSTEYVHPEQPRLQASIFQRHKPNCFTYNGCSTVICSFSVGSFLVPEGFCYSTLAIGVVLDKRSVGSITPIASLTALSLAVETYLVRLVALPNGMQRRSSIPESSVLASFRCHHADLHNSPRSLTKGKVD